MENAAQKLTSPGLCDIEVTPSSFAITICDRCADEVHQDETQNGPEGTEWETCNLCNDCYAVELL